MVYHLSDGFDSRLEDFVDVTKALILLGLLIYIAMLINQFIPMVLFLNIIALFYVVITVTVVVGVLALPEYGVLFTIGWTIASLVLAWVGLIGVGELFLDLLPIAIVAYQMLQGRDLDDFFKPGW